MSNVLSIVIGFLAGVATYNFYLLHKLCRTSKNDDVTDMFLKASKDTLTELIRPNRARVISPSKKKIADDLLKGLEDE